MIDYLIWVKLHHCGSYQESGTWCWPWHLIYRFSEMLLSIRWKWELKLIIVKTYLLGLTPAGLAFTCGLNVVGIMDHSHFQIKGFNRLHQQVDLSRWWWVWLDQWEYWGLACLWSQAACNLGKSLWTVIS